MLYDAGRVYGGAHLFCEPLTVRIWRLRDIWRPPSSPTATSAKDASKASSSSSLTSVLDSPSVRFVDLDMNDSIFHSRIVASCEPDASMSGSLSFSGCRNAKLRTQSSWPDKIADETNYKEI